MPRLNASQSTRVFQWKRQTIISDSRIPPVLDTQYSVLHVTKGCRLRYITVFQVNDEAAAKTLQVHLIIDGQLVDGEAAVTSGARRRAYVANMDQLTLGAEGKVYPTAMFTTDNIVISELTSGHDIEVKYNQHSANGTNQEIAINVEYDIWAEIT